MGGGENRYLVSVTNISVCRCNVRRSQRGRECCDRLPAKALPFCGTLTVLVHKTGQKVGATWWRDSSLERNHVVASNTFGSVAGPCICCVRIGARQWPGPLATHRMEFMVCFRWV
jgi:hypothetical protein